MTKKSTFVPAKDLSKLWRAIIEFDMLQPGDRILVGLSGGKDSMLLTAMLAEIKKYSPIPFDLACYTVNGMFAPNFPKAELEAFCAQFGLTHYSDDVDVMAAHEKERQSLLHLRLLPPRRYQPPRTGTRLQQGGVGAPQ